jgi:hypothetical protein
MMKSHEITRAKLAKTNREISTLAMLVRAARIAGDAHGLRRYKALEAALRARKRRLTAKLENGGPL